MTDNTDFMNIDKFSEKEWSAEWLYTPENARREAIALNFKGRKIKRLRFIGLCYDLRRDDIEEYAYLRLEGYEEKKRHLLASYDYISPEMPFPRAVEIDEPLLIQFEDGDVLEIESPRENEYRMSINHVPWWTHAEINNPNASADVIFSPCIGKCIESVDIVTDLSEKDPICRLYGSMSELVSRLEIRFNDGNGMCFSGLDDFCHVAYLNPVNEVGRMPFRQLKEALYNWEDIHIDEESNFEARTGTFYFGRKGAEWVKTPFLTIGPLHSNSALHIHDEDFLLFDWSIIMQIRDWFDEYANYEFTKAQWDEILSNAEKLLSFENPQSLFEYLLELEIMDWKGTDIFRYRWESQGKEFCQKKELFGKQLADMKLWSRLVLDPDDTMLIYGA